MEDTKFDTLRHSLIEDPQASHADGEWAQFPSVASGHSCNSGLLVGLPQRSIPISAIELCGRCRAGAPEPQTGGGPHGFRRRSDGRRQRGRLRLRGRIFEAWAFCGHLRHQRHCSASDRPPQAESWHRRIRNRDRRWERACGVLQLSLCVQPCAIISRSGNLL